MNHKCQITVSDSGKFNGVEHYWPCDKPAKAWIKDSMNRCGNHRLYVCGIHRLSHDRHAQKYNKPLATTI